MLSFFKKKPTASIELFNTKGREKQTFEPIKGGRVKMYSCGPTVYDYIHIGNLRAYVLSDITRRTFEYAGYNVTQVMNFTDFGHLTSDEDEGEDKMMKGLRREGKELTMENMFALASTYIDAYQQDREEMNILKPHMMPRASEHVGGQIAYVETLLHKDYAYKTSDGIYFDTAKFPEYGILGGSASEDHSRVGVNTEKKNQKDFAIWKFNNEMGWDAPWGKGFPGWHIECTAMSTHYLGKTFDVHTGGVDNIPIHHNNEIAQAEAANSKPLATYWLHNEHVTIDSKRIGKSEGNAITLKQFSDRGISALSYRYWLLTGHYRQSVNFTWEAVEAAQTALKRAQKIFVDLKGSGKVDEDYQEKFQTALYDDLNTPEAIAVLWELLKDTHIDPGVKRATVLDFDRVLGLGFAKARKQLEVEKISVTSEAPESVQQLLEEREEARAAQDYKKADEIRDRILEAGYTIEDGQEGPVLHKTVGES